LAPGVIPRIFQSRMNQNKFILVIIMSVGLLIAVFIGIYLPTNSTGSLAGFVKVIGFGCIVMALVNPRLGFSILVVQGAYFDLLKRLAVYFGRDSFQTVIEILIVPMLTLLACAIGGIVRSVMQKGSLSKRDAILFGIVGFAAVIIFWKQTMGMGIMRGAQMTFGNVAYMLYVPLFLIVMKDLDDLMKYLRFIFWALLPAAVYGLKQAVFGFTEFEWHYAETGFTITAGEMFAAVPRPFATLSSVSAMTIMAGLAYFGYWHVLNHRQKRILYTLAAMVYAAAMLSSLGRTAIIVLPLSIVTYHMIKTPVRTLMVYSGALVGFVLVVIYADSLLRALPAVEEMMPISNEYTQKAFRVGTASSRLVGLSKLTDSSRWTLFGVSGEEVRNSVRYERYSSKYYAHDAINGMLLKYGAVGLFGILGAGIFGFAWCHHMIFRIKDRELRSLANLGIGYMIPFVFANLVGGSIFHVSPLNLFFWSLGATTVYCIVLERERVRAMVQESLPESALPGGMPTMAGRRIPFKQSGIPSVATSAPDQGSRPTT